MTEHYNIKVYGKVQGVGFRYNCMREARSIGLCGFVKNMPDGSVYIEAEGEDYEIERLLLWCQQGPTMARVHKIVKSKSPLENFQSFQIQ